MDPLQVIKLSYLSHGWMLGLYSRPLSGQPVEAWRYGPVIPDIYHTVKIFGSERITRLPVSDRGSFDELEDDLIEQVFGVYGDFSGIELSQMTHAPGTPWYRTWHQHGRNAVISDELIENHFAELADSDE